MTIFPASRFLMNPKEIIRVKWFVLAVLAMIVVVVLTHIPGSLANDRIEGWDKLAHVIAYGTIAFLLLRAIAGRRRFLVFAIVFLVLGGIGMVDELTQPLVNRTASIYDWLADCLGVVLAGILLQLKTLINRP